VDDDIRMISDAAARIFADLADPRTLNAATDESWRAPLWQALEEAGLTRAWLPETAGGAGLPLDCGFEILRVSGQYACPVALAETLLAGWALVEAGLEAPDGAIALGPVRTRDALAFDGATVTGVARSVPHAAEAGLVVLMLENRLLCFDPAAVHMDPCDADMGGARADVRFERAAPTAMADLPQAAERMMAMGAVARACQMTGALETALAMTAEYTGEREAFGRKIGKFQAVQQNMARLAGEVAAAMTAAGSAADTLASENHASEAAFLEAAAAKIRVGEAAYEGAMIAHQTHGAIGWTSEHTLQRFTRRLFGWRDDFGSEAEWALRLGRHVARRGAERCWPMLTAR